MDINEKNQQVNQFHEGMNTDVSDFLLRDGEYRLANNLRYITDTEENTGEFRLIEGAKLSKAFEGDVIESTSIRDYGILITKSTTISSTAPVYKWDVVGLREVLVTVYNPQPSAELDPQSTASTDRYLQLKHYITNKSAGKSLNIIIESPIDQNGIKHDIYFDEWTYFFTAKFKSVENDTDVYRYVDITGDYNGIYCTGSIIQTPFSNNETFEGFVINNALIGSGSGYSNMQQTTYYGGTTPGIRIYDMSEYPAVFKDVTNEITQHDVYFAITQQSTITETEDIYGWVIDEDTPPQEITVPCWYIYRFDNPYYKLDKDFKEISDFTKVFGPCTDPIWDLDDQGNIKYRKLSFVSKWEDNDNVKLYIADGVHLIMSVNIMKDNKNADGEYLVDDILIYPQIEFKKPVFAGIISGTLKGGLVQYSYQLYDKYGHSTEISPTTKLIPIPDKISSDGKNINGVEQDSTSGSGVKIRIDIDDKYSHLDNILIYRIQYEQNGQLPIISVIYDGKYQTGQYYFQDRGQSSVSLLSLEEYNGMSGTHIIPKMIESKDDYLFAANIKNEISHINAFDDWDARAFLFDNNDNKTHLYDYSTDKTFEWLYLGYDPVGPSPHQFGMTLTEINAKSGWADSVKQAFKTFDCYNKYTNVNETFDEVESNHSGQNDRFFKEGNNYYYGGEGINVKWQFIVTEIPGDACITAGPNDGGALKNTGTVSNAISFNDGNVFESDDVKVARIKSNGELDILDAVDASDFFETTEVANSTYANPSVSYYLKSLRRDEVYRYGIVLYDKYGNASPVKWIADIRTPNASWDGFQPFMANANYKGSYVDLIVRPLGIQFFVSNLPADCVKYEIVRCQRTESDKATITQGVVSRPIHRILVKDYSGTQDRTYPYQPSGFISVNNMWFGGHPEARYGLYDVRTDDRYYEADNYDNKDIYQFISPEVVYHPESAYNLLKGRQLSINTISYLYGSHCDGHEENRYMSTQNGLPGITEGWDGDFFNIIRPGVANTNILLMPFTIGYNFKSVQINEIKYPNETNQKLFLSVFSLFVPASFYDVHLYEVRSAIGSGMYHSGNMVYDCFSTIRPTINTKPYTQLTDIGIYQYGTLSQTPTYVTRTPNNEGLLHIYYWKDAAQQVNSYIKLYNQTKNVWGKYHNVNTDGVPLKYYPDSSDSHYNENEYEYEEMLLSHIMKTDNKCGIVDIKNAHDLSWSDKYNKESKTLSEASLKYVDSIVSIGSNNYCNWVSGGLYDIKDYDGYSVDEWLESMDPNSTYQLQGPGGRCAILQINNKWEREYNKPVADQTKNYKSYLMFDTMAAYKIDRAVEVVSNNYTFNKLVNTNLENPSGLSALTIYGYDGSTKGDKYIHPESVLGTYLCNIRQVANPYNGTYATSINNSTYYSYGDYFDKSVQTASVFDGDCYILPLEYVSMHKQYSNLVNYNITHSIVYSIPVETSLNLAYTYGEEFSKNKDVARISNLQINPSNVYNQFVQSKPLYQYNTAYNSEPTTKIHKGYDPEDDEYNSKTVDYRVMHSNPKSNDEILDSWTRFQPANYIDVDTRYGLITDLRRFHNALVFWQKNAVGLLSVNERTAITDNSNMPLLLGTGGILSRYDYLATTNGMKEDQYADVQSDTTLYWWDYDNATICSYSGGQEVQQLSKIKNVLNFLDARKKENNLNEKPVLSFDKRYAELIFGVTHGENQNDGAIVYSERQQSFTSLYNITPKNSIYFPGCLYLVDDNIYEWNRPSGNVATYKTTALLPYIKYVINKTPVYNKVYDNVTFGGRFYGGDDLHNLLFIFNTPLKQTGKIIDGDHIENREYDFRFSIPRSGKDVVRTIDGQQVNMWYTEPYGDRLRGKTMQCEMSSTSNILDFSLQYIITKFRISWS